MDTKHTTDTLKTMRGKIKGEMDNLHHSLNLKKQWNIISIYHENKKEEFEMEIINEDKENYYVRLLPEYHDKFQEKDTITPLRKELIGKIYELKEKPKQMSIFEFYSQ